MIDYNPVGAVAALAGRRNFIETVNTGTGPGGLNAPNIGSPDTAGEGERDAPGTVPAPQQGGTAPNQGLVNYAVDQDQAGTNVGSGTIDPATGKVTGQTAADMPGIPQNVRVSPQQKIQLDNFKATGVSGDAYMSGVRKILGLPEPMVSYTAPDGTKLELPASQAAQYKARDAAATEKQQEFQTKNQNWMTAESRRQDAAADRVDAEQQLQKFREDQAMTAHENKTLAQQQTAQKTQWGLEDGAQAANEKYAESLAAVAKGKRDDYVREKGKDLDPGDQGLAALNQQAEQAAMNVSQIKLAGMQQRTKRQVANQPAGAKKADDAGASAPRPDKTPDGKAIIYGDGGGYLTDGTHYSSPDGSLISASGRPMAQGPDGKWYYTK